MRKKELLQWIKKNQANLDDELRLLNGLHIYSGFLNPEQSAALKKELDLIDKNVVKNTNKSVIKSIM
jgi:hypothetical protein